MVTSRSALWVARPAGALPNGCLFLHDLARKHPTANGHVEVGTVGRETRRSIAERGHMFKFKATQRKLDDSVSSLTSVVEQLKHSHTNAMQKG
jgi:hypothetical protein